MKLSFSLVLLSLAAPFLANAQCPADPLQKLNGQQWVFELISSDYRQTGSAAIGRFSASVVGGQGVLNVTETINDGLGVIRLAATSGRYQVYPDCSGGVLMFMWNGYAAQLEFVFINASEMYLVTTSLRTSLSFITTLTGTAKLTSPPTCPAGVTPLQTLLNSSWTLRTLNSQWERPGGSGSVGFFNASIVNGQGFLSAVETVNNNGAVTRLAAESGRYTVYADCSGGQVTLTNRTVPVQFEFIFTSPALDEMYMVTNTTSSGLAILVGQARKRALSAACPANALDFIGSSTWSFRSRASQVTANKDGNSAAAIGRFTTSVVNGRGALSLTETYRDGASITRGAQGSGRFDVYPDCSGGALLFNVNGQAVQLEFVIAGDNELDFVSEGASGLQDPQAVLVGKAIRNAPSACPAGVSPLQLLEGSSWAFRTFDPYFPFPPFNTAFGSASVGIFKPAIVKGAGTLTAVETVNNGGEITRLAQESGRYSVEADCSGGVIMLMDREQPVQMEFVFADANFNQMFMLSDSLTFNFGRTLLAGDARKQ